MLRLRLPWFGDNRLLLAEIELELALAGVSEPVLLRASETDKLDRIERFGTDRGGYPGDRRWRYDDSIRHEDVVLATTPEDNRDAEANPDASSSLKKLPGIDAPLVLVYRRSALRKLREHHWVFSAGRLDALIGIIEIAKYPPIQGWFSPRKGMAYRGLVEQVVRPEATIVEVGCWRGLSTSYVARLVERRGARLTCVDDWGGSSDEHGPAYRAMLAESDVRAEFRQTLARLGVEPTVLEMDSLRAATQLADGSVDLCFVDASHDRVAVQADLDAWAPKVRADGILAGDDFSAEYPGVVEAVTGAAKRLGRRIVHPTEGLWQLV